MASFRLISIFCSFLILVSQTSAQPFYLGHSCHYENGNYTANSTYATNLHTLLSTLSTNTEIDYGFYDFSYGQSSDKVNAIGLCRADLSIDSCLSCLNLSRTRLSQDCPNQKEAIVYHDICMLRYSNRSIFGIMEDSPLFSLSNPNNVSDGEKDKFSQILNNLMHNLTNMAASGDSRRKVAERKVSAGSQPIFGLVQCTPHLSHGDCENCLLAAISVISSCCENKIGGRVHRPSCNSRFEIYSFHGAIADEPLEVSSPPPSTNKTEGKRNTLIMTIVVAVVAILYYWSSSASIE